MPQTYMILLADNKKGGILKVAVLCNEVEWTEKRILKLLNRRGHEVHFYKVGDEPLFDADFVLNRYKPSVAAADDKFNLADYILTMDKIDQLAIPMVNSKWASTCHFNKFVSALALHQHQVRTPETLTADSAESALEITNKILKYPVVKKPSMNGRTMGGMKLIETRDQLASEKGWKPMHGFIIMQKFLKSVEFHDYQIYICDNALMLGHQRTLMNDWMGSQYGTSKIKSMSNIDIPIDVVSESMLASKAIDAWFNCCDVVMTKDGPYVVDINPAPNFTDQSVEWYGFDPLEVFVNKLEEKWLEQPKLKRMPGEM